MQIPAMKGRGAVLKADSSISGLAKAGISFLKLNPKNSASKSRRAVLKLNHSNSISEKREF